MNGSIKNFLPQKQFGFIAGEDGKDYFFHQNSLTSLKQLPEIFDGVTVEFNPGVTPKGYKATQVTIKPQSAIARYIVPDKIFISKQDSVEGWETLEESSWIITASGRGNPDDVKSELKGYARKIGANGITYLNYYKDTGSSGNYRFTIHRFTGRAVALGKRSVSGEYESCDLKIINSTASRFKKMWNDQYETDKKRHKKRVYIALGASALISLVLKASGVALGLIIMLCVLIINRPIRVGEWLQEDRR